MNRLNCTITKPKSNSKPVEKNTAVVLSNKFRQNGQSVNFTSRRGAQSKLVTLNFLGLNSFAVGKRINFDYDSVLSLQPLKGIELLGTAQMARPLLSPGVDIPQSELVKGYLVLVDHCDNEIIQIPLSTLCKALNGNKVTFINIPQANWAASYVRFPDGSTSISSANALVFNVYYNN
jgi:hypothetical protein